MNERTTKVFLITFNVVVLMAGMAMLVGGLLLEYLPMSSVILQTLHNNVTESQLGTIGVALIAVGAFVFLISFAGCCGATYESPFLLGIYFIVLLLLFLAQIGIAIASFVLGIGEFVELINTQLQPLVNNYGDSNSATEDALVDSVQQFFQCCGYNGTRDYKYYIPSSQTTTAISTTLPSISATTAVYTATTAVYTATTAANTPDEEYFTGLFWPSSCCKLDADVDLCQNNTLPVSTLQTYLNTEGCTMMIEQWVQTNLFIIGGVAAAIALFELISLIMACSLRNSLD